jgi:hypothetical protein
VSHRELANVAQALEDWTVNGPPLFVRQIHELVDRISDALGLGQGRSIAE